MLECPFANSEFDWVVAIGCFHHTGNLQLALDEAWRVLKPGGRAMIMVYNAYSYRRWGSEPRATWLHFLHDKLGIAKQPSIASDRERAHYDASTKDGASAPETVFTSVTEMRRMVKKWSSCDISRENIGKEGPFRMWPRGAAIRIAGPCMGLDIYCALQK